MKHIIISVICLLCAFELQATEKIIVEIDHWCPYTCDPSRNNGKSGILLDLVQAIFTSPKYSLEVRFVPWARILRDLKNGTADLALGINPVDDPDLIFSASPILQTRCSFFTEQNEKWNYNTPSSLTNVRFGAVVGWGYADELQKYIEANPKKVEIVSGEKAVELNITKTLHQRIDTFFEEINVVYNTMDNLGIDRKNLRLAGSVPGTASNLHIAFSPKTKKAQDYIQYFNKAFDKFKKSKQWLLLKDAYRLHNP